MGRLSNVCGLAFFVLPGLFCHEAAGNLQEVPFQQRLFDEPVVTFTPSWSVLGPFRIGTREAVWGADPIEFYGGINQLNENEDSHYHSSLTRNATVHWSSRIFDTITSGAMASIEVVVGFPDIDWIFAQQIYGWSAFQFQAWVKGGIFNHDVERRKVTLYPQSILELWFNDRHVFGGDFYAFGTVPVVLELEPGLNAISIRLVRDVRSMGGSYPPTMHATLQTELVSEPLEVVEDSVLLPDVVNGRFCSRYGSVVIRNQADTWIKIHEITAMSQNSHLDVMTEETSLAPGQSRPLKLVLDSLRNLNDTMTFTVAYTRKASHRHKRSFETKLRHENISSLQKMTYLHRSGAVSYAILRPPPSRLPASLDQKAHVLLNLHGAGVDVDDPLARHMFDDTPDLPAWIVTPAGMTPWSGDDWHTWGFADAQAALSGLQEWINTTKWSGPGLISDRILVAGHSNGGQGTWYFATHQPDMVLGAAAASPYSSIENYVPFGFWNEADPLQDAVLHIARNNFRHELLAENLVGVPIFQQHGSDDDNVPAYHSRLMNTLLAQAGSSANYSEMPGKGHWFTGTMTTSTMVDFYMSHLQPAINDTLSSPASFSFVVPNSDDFGSRFGIIVHQLTSPDRLGHVQVSINESKPIIRWHVKTQNIHRFQLDPTVAQHSPAELILDDTPHIFDVGHISRANTFVLTQSNVWAREVALDWRLLEQRYGRQRGALDSILRSAGPFEVVYGPDEVLPIALQTSRNFLQYFGADSKIVPRSMYEHALSNNGNVITIALDKGLSPPLIPMFPIKVEAGRLSLATKDGETISIPRTPGMGGVWLRPLPEERLELVIWGHDESGLQQAARLIPTLAGVGQPDFVILSNEARWKGHAGAVAMGFFDYNWRISDASYLP
ncbi:hypothetical protein PV11_01720 [Exophiala sideris]|uniref:Peptidase S9 prolyl oligopeptidase catalytic domain-containing protein n=1 Tax=Exophiala sideris TaxID=1016849 RepID=A0A0D1ZGZ5_9EURO|nr:hypothetical protein PV11_01720 [Exophiala sideris]